MSPEGRDASERAQGRPEAISRPPDPGAVENPFPDLAPQPAFNYFWTSDTKFFALGRCSGPGGPKCHLKWGSASERAQSRPGVISRPLDPGSVANPSRDLGPQTANYFPGASDAK